MPITRSANGRRCWMGPREVMLSGLAPTLIAVVVLLLGHILLSRRNGEGDPRSVSWLTPMLMLGGLLLGAWVWQSRIDWWADSVTHRFPAIGLAAFAVGLISTLLPKATKAPARIVTTFMLGALGGTFVAWAVLGPLHESLIGSAERWVWIGAVGIVAGAQSLSIGAVTGRLIGWRAPAVLWLLMGVIGLGVTSGFANGPLVLWPIAGVMFASVLVGWLMPSSNLLRGTAPSFAVLISGTVSFSHWFGDQERWLMFALLMAAPLALGLAALPALRSRKWARLIIPAGVALLLAGIQAGIAVPGLLEASGGSSGGYDYDY